MRINLRFRLLLLFLLVSILALSASFMLRQLILTDFNHYIDGEAEDRVYKTIAQFEGGYDAFGGWQKVEIANNFAWTLQLGFEARLFDAHKKEILDTKSALRILPEGLQKRIAQTVDLEQATSKGEYTSYPLFLKGEEIGRLDLRPLHSAKENFFIASTTKFLLVSLLILGILSIFISIISARAITAPILELTELSRAIAEGDMSQRTSIVRGDELGVLATTFNIMADKIEKQEELRRHLLSSAAHELRTPLAIISGELEAMIDGVLPTTTAGLTSMHDEASRLKSILNGVDDLTKAESASLHLEMQQFYLKPFLTAIAERYRQLFDQKDCYITVESDDNLALNADPDRISQIVINLLSNAYKALDKGGNCVVSATEEAGSIVLKVKDNGCGIKEVEIPHIFERFYSKSDGGLGIGLAIAKELVLAHKGKISVTSSNMGTEFVIELPKV